MDGKPGPEKVLLSTNIIHENAKWLSKHLVESLVEGSVEDKVSSK